MLLRAPGGKVHGHHLWSSSSHTLVIIRWLHTDDDPSAVETLYIPRFVRNFTPFLLYLVLINISYDHLNTGQLLFLLPNAELKQSVRNLERFYKRYISAKTGILFNKTCLNEGLFPNYTNIYIYIYIYIYMSATAFDPYLKTSMWQPLPAGQYLQTSMCQPLPAGPCLKTSMCQPPPAGPCLKTSMCQPLPLGPCLKTSMYPPLPAGPCANLHLQVTVWRRPCANLHLRGPRSVETMQQRLSSQLYRIAYTLKDLYSALLINIINSLPDKLVFIFHYAVMKLWCKL